MNWKSLVRPGMAKTTGPVVLEKNIFNLHQCQCIFAIFHNYLPLKKEMGLNLYKLKSPSPKDALCQVW